MRLRAPPPFGVDFDACEVILFDGTRWPVETWYDAMSNECEPERAAACIFQGAFALWYAVDLRALHYPDVVN